MPKTLFKTKTGKAFARTPFQVSVHQEVLDEIRQIPNWQDKFREMLPEIIERLKEI